MTFCEETPLPQPNTLPNPFFAALNQLLEKVQTTQGDAIRQAGLLIAKCVMGDGIIHVFGTGHSHILAEEMFVRAGGLVPVSPIFDGGLMLHESALTSTTLERLEGYAHIVLNRYPLYPEDIMIIISNSGRNAVPIEAAMEARAHGLPVIALTSLEQSRRNSSRHSSGKHLYELADVVLDNCGYPGDAAVQLEGLATRICPTSTIINAALLQAAVCEAVQEMLRCNFPPPLLESCNIDSDQNPWDIYEPYWKRIRHL